MSMEGGGIAKINYDYNDEGIRTKKDIDGEVHTYTLEGSCIVSEAWNDILIVYLYDESGAPIGMQYRTSSMAENTFYTFYFEKNLQGDIVAVYNENGVKVVAYTYDAWGNFTTNYYATAGTNWYALNNPFRYRGYYYDSEIGLYYLQSRYYNPQWGRFLNADGLISTGTGLLGCNMYAYCGNNPVNRIDPLGTFWKELWDGFTHTLQQNSAYFAFAGGISQVDSPLPGYADLVAVVLMAGGVLVCAGVATHTAITAPAPSISKPKENVEEKEEAIPAPPSSTVIYRYGGINPGNLTPRSKDRYTGLSFSTVPMPGAAMTTIEALNATGLVYAVQDGPTHVSVKPVGVPVQMWIDAGPNSIWTQAVKSVVIKLN